MFLLTLHRSVSFSYNIKDNIKEYKVKVGY